MELLSRAFIFYYLYKVLYFVDRNRNIQLHQYLLKKSFIMTLKK